MNIYIIIDSEGYYTNKVGVGTGITAANFDADTWIEITDSENYERKRYVDGAWVDMLVPVEDLRVERDELLRASDFTQLSDAPHTSAEKALWATYRQELRDLPENYVEVAEPTYPTQP